MCLNPGDILNGHFKIISRIGRGGFGRTYKARDLRHIDHPLCVVKEIIPPQSPNPQVVQEVEKRFQREAKTLSQLGEHSQIPKFFEYFAKDQKFYLIQEYIEGHDLSEELTPESPPWEQEDVISLLKDVLTVLAYVHQQQMVHRDIKPSNLRRRKSDGKIVLLDFGAVKTFSSLAFVPGVTQAIGTPGYMAAEQQSGNPQLNSDLYALGMICIQALTGLHPRTLPSDPNTGDIIWRYATAERNMVEVDANLEEILDKMVRYHFSDRYYSAVEALEDVNRLMTTPSSSQKVRQRRRKPNTPLNPWRKRSFIGLGGAVLLLVFGGWQVSQSRSQTCPLIMGDDISCGEEILIKTTAPDEKKAGVKAFAQGKYQEAIDWLEKVRQKSPTDPETLIYLNNARLKAKNIPFYTIAVAASLGNPADGGDSGKEILRGVAQLQTEINENPALNGRGLRVVIADDYNEADRAQTIAQQLVNQPDILGVVGHYSSDSTRSALPIYQINDLVLISPTSTAQTLAQDNPVFFRTVPPDSVSAEVLAAYLYHIAKQEKVTVFYNPNSAYSRSLSERFRLSFDQQGGQVVKEFDVSQSIFDADDAIAQGERRGATGLILLPDAKVDPYAFFNVLKIIRANRDRHLMAGGDSLYTTDILQEKGIAEGLIVAIPWHHLGTNNEAFNQMVQQLWGGTVSWRTATAYDATQVLAVGLEQQSSLGFWDTIRSFFDPSLRRENLLKTLKRPNFEAKGATGDIHFELTGDRAEKVVQLVKVMASRCSPYGYLFLPVEYTEEEAKALKCY